MTVEGEYEVDGDRVIIRTTRSNDVFKREGAWLRNAMSRAARWPPSRDRDGERYSRRPSHV